MSLSLLNANIERVAVVDDQAAVRRTYAYPIEDLDLTPVDIDKLGHLGDSVARLLNTAHAAVCDYQLRVSNYAEFNGAELVAELYKHSMPAVLCTRFEKSMIDEIRRYRARIPCLVAPPLDVDSLVKGFESCVKEFRQEFADDRRTWRTLIRAQSVETHYVYLFVPAWNSGEAVRLLKSDLPDDVAARIAAGYRCHARVNLGATRQEDLFFTTWEA